MDFLATYRVNTPCVNAHLSKRRHSAVNLLHLLREFYPAHHGSSKKFILHLAQRVQPAGHQVTYDKQNGFLPSGQ